MTKNDMAVVKVRVFTLQGDQGEHEVNPTWSKEEIADDLADRIIGTGEACMVRAAARNSYSLYLHNPTGAQKVLTRKLADGDSVTLAAPMGVDG